MNQQVVDLWVEALESGKYKQTTERLADENGYCCLGVLCELYCKNVTDIKSPYQVIKVNEDECDSDGNREEITINCFKYSIEYEILPKEVQEWVGLNSNDGKYNKPNNTLETLASLNDEGRTFKEIAAIIKSKPSGLFSQLARD